MRLNPPSAGLASTAVFVSASVWGLYWIPLRYLETRGIAGSLAVFMINAPAAILLSLVVLWQFRALRGHMWHAAAIGVITGLALALYGSGLVFSSVMRTTLLFYLTPVWATLIGIFWLDEKATVMRWVAIAIGLIGLLLLVSGGDGSIPIGIGDVFAFFSGIFWALGAAMIKRFNTVPLIGMTMFQFASTAVCGVLLGAVAGVFEIPQASLVTAVLPMAALVSLCVIFPAVIVLFWAQKFLFPGRVGLLMMSEVLVAAFTASLFIPEERMNVIEWTGAALIIGACLVEVLLTPAEIT